MTSYRETGRFPRDVADVLRAAGWHDGRRMDAEAAAVIREMDRQIGLRSLARHEIVRPARAAITEFFGIVVQHEEKGLECRRSSFAIDPRLAAASIEALTDLGALVGSPLYPLGAEGDRESIIAIDRDGRVFALDAQGEWYLGDSFDAALITLVRGLLPRRVGDRGEW